MDSNYASLKLCFGETQKSLELLFITKSIYNSKIKNEYKITNFPNDLTDSQWDSTDALEVLKYSVGIIDALDN